MTRPEESILLFVSKIELSAEVGLWDIFLILFYNTIMFYFCIFLISFIFYSKLYESVNFYGIIQLLKEYSNMLSSYNFDFIKIMNVFLLQMGLKIHFIPLEYFFQAVAVSVLLYGSTP